MEGMKPTIALICALPLLCSAEVRTLTMREVLDIALKQSPDILIARFDEQKAAEAVRIARDPFTPKVVVGSGLAYTSGFPMSVEGSAPSIVQARVIQSVYNKPRSYEVAAARENLRGAGIDVAAKRDEVVYRTALLYIDSEQIARSLDAAKQQLASFEKIAETTTVRVGEGRELPIEQKRAELRVSQARQQVSQLDSDRDHAEATLAVILGFGADDRVRAVERETGLPAPASEEASVDSALTNSKELKRLESAMQVRGLEARSARAARLPQMDLIAQYGLFAKFNNYDDFFRRFDRHNGQVGVSIALPILPGGGAPARAAQAEIEMLRIRTQVTVARDRITLDTRKAFHDIRRAESATDVARLDLEVAREQLSILLAQFNEGRATLRQVEEARAAESGKWLSFYEARHAAERARLELLRQTGTLSASIR
jgi:outer membrane protein